jgi:large subunit ribosomal protein L23
VSKSHSIIRYPSITERNTTLQNLHNKYVFQVDPKATKKEVKSAIEEIFGVTVEKVNTMVVKGKQKRMGRYVGYRPNWKKAIVKLQKGQRIDKFTEV